VGSIRSNRNRGARSAPRVTFLRIPARTEYLPPGDAPKPIRIHRSSSSRSTRPASISSPSRYEVFAAPRCAREPGTGDGAGALYADVVAALRGLAEMIDQRLEFGASGGEQGFAVKLCGQDLIFGRHMAQCHLARPTFC
jgi:hypothetical protein